MYTILLATHNKAKLNELMLGSKDLIENGWNIVSLDELKIKDDPEETGKMFDDNSRLKAIYYGTISNLPTMADDGGLMIDYLDGGPGVKSKRWLGYDASDREMIDFALQKLKNVPLDKRTAVLKTSVCYFNPLSKKIYIETESIKGHIALTPSPRPTNGYPYRALFIVEKFNKYYDELTGKEHEEMNHRIMALKRLIEIIKMDLLQ